MSPGLARVASAHARPFFLFLALPGQRALNGAAGERREEVAWLAAGRGTLATVARREVVVVVARTPAAAQHGNRHRQRATSVTGDDGAAERLAGHGLRID